MNNIIIPLLQASIGDAIAIKTGVTGETPSDFIAVVGSTVVSTPPSGYAWYGVVYGKERQGLMVAHHNQASRKWAEYEDTATYGNIAAGATVTFDATQHSSIIDNTVGGGRNGMLNGNLSTNVAMSLSEVITRVNVSSNTSTALHPSSAHLSNSTVCPMNKTNFEANVNGAKSKFGNYEAYVAQTQPLLKGYAAGCFQPRCGWINSKQMCDYSGTRAYIAGNSAAYAVFPPAEYCRSIKVASEAANHWWLPDMYELAIMMRDESFATCATTASAMGGSYHGTNSIRWSSVRNDSTSVWYYDNYGFSYVGRFLLNLLACPVTLVNY